MNTSINRSANQVRFASAASSREFLAELFSFHARRRTGCTGIIPMLNGRPINLHKLYLTVCSLGGCRKVSDKNRWFQVCTDSGFSTTAICDVSVSALTPDSCTNLAYACKLTYLRWLEIFERVHLFGQPEELVTAGGAYNSLGYFDDAFDTSYSTATRTRRSFGPGGSDMSIGPNPLDTISNQASNRGFQLLVDSASRRDNGLVGDTRDANEYDRIALALLSGLPNEVDFAFNALVILAVSPHRSEHGTERERDRERRRRLSAEASVSNELDLRRAPWLVDLVLAHIGFYSSDADSLFVLDSAWRHATHQNYFRFWWQATSAMASRPARKFLFPRCFASDSSELEDDKKDFDPLQTGEDLLRESSEAARVYQAALILHAASFDSHRSEVLLARDTLIRFGLVAASCREFPAVRRLALEMIINLCASTRGMHVLLKDHPRLAAVSERKRFALLGLARTLLESPDRDDVLTGLELVTAIARGLQRPPTNNNASGKAVQKHEAHSERAAAFMRVAIGSADVVAPCYHLLLVADTALVVGALEALLALASTRLRSFADHVAIQLPQLLNLLVYFISMDSRSLGKLAMRGVNIMLESVAVTGRHARRDRVRAAVTFHQPLQAVNTVAIAPSRLPMQPMIAMPNTASAPTIAACTRTSSTQVPTQVPQIPQHGRAAALQWLFLRCELSDSAPVGSTTTRSSRSAASEITSEADLYADYVRYVNTSGRAHADACATCGAPSTARCSCVSLAQALSLIDLKNVMRQVYPQIREAPSGGFYGLKLKPYFHSSAKTRPTGNNVPPTPAVMVKTGTSANFAQAMVNGDDKAYSSGNGIKRRSVSSGSSEDEEEVKEPSVELHAKDRKAALTEPPAKRGRGRPPMKRVLGSDGREYISTPYGLRKPQIRRPVQKTEQHPVNGIATTTLVNGHKEPITDHRSTEVSLSSHPNANGDAQVAAATDKECLQPSEAVVFAGQASSSTQMAANTIGSNRDEISSCGVTREVVIERIKGKLGLQSADQMCNMNGVAHGSGHEPQVDSNSAQPPLLLVNGTTEGHKPVKLGELGDATVHTENGVNPGPQLSWQSRNGNHSDSEMNATNGADEPVKNTVDALKDATAAKLNGFRSIEKAACISNHNKDAEAVENHAEVATHPVATTMSFSQALMSVEDVELNLEKATSNGLINSLPYQCKWQIGYQPNAFMTVCSSSFGTLRELRAHAFAAHCSVPMNSCCWVGCSQNTLQRSGYSLYMHLEDNHCRESEFKSSSAPTAPRPVVVYPPNAALQAVRKLAPRPPFSEMIDVPEGVLTKHIRLTSSLLLHSICDLSPVARDALQQHVPTLAQLAFADRDASPMIARILQRLSMHELAVSVYSSSAV